MQVNFLNPFLVSVLILYPLKTQKTQDFVGFLGGIKWGHWPEMGQDIYETVNRSFKSVDSVLYNENLGLKWVILFPAYGKGSIVFDKCFL